MLQEIQVTGVKNDPNGESGGGGGGGGGGGWWIFSGITHEFLPL